MPSKIIRLYWFLSSYTPLWIILCISNWPETNSKTSETEGFLPLSITFILIILISNAIVLMYLSDCRKREKQHEGEIKKIKAVSDLSREYIVTYAISLIGFNLPEKKDTISFIVLLAFFAYLYVKHDQIIYNPMLEIFGYKLYEIQMLMIDLPKVEEKYVTREGILISKNSSDYLNKYLIPFIEIGHDDLFVEVKT